MKDINDYNVTGRLTRDAELKYTANGLAICSFSIAFNRSQKKGDGWEDKACFIDCIIYAKRGEVLNSMLTKGKQVAMSGELDHQRWSDSEGKTHNKHVVIVNDIVIPSNNKGNDAAGAKPGNVPVEDDFIDDIPF